MNNHTPEPWEKSEKANGNWWHISAGNQAIAAVHAASKKRNEPYASMFEENARRIVACVNACAGMETEHLENQAMLGETLLDRFSLFKREADELAKQRYELLAELDIIHRIASGSTMTHNMMVISKHCIAAKAKGGAS